MASANILGSQKHQTHNNQSQMISIVLSKHPLQTQYQIPIW